MVVPTKAEIEKKEKQYQQHLKKLDEEGRMKDHLAINSLRSAIRKEWMRNPAKLAVLHEAMVPDMNPDTRTKWLFKCAITGNLFKASEVEVDHIKGEHSLIKAEDFLEYYDKILRTPKSMLQVLSKEAHAIKTYMERYNVTWEEAVSRKKLIAKINQKSGDQKRELSALGFSPVEISNAEKRESIYQKLFEEGKLQ